MQCFISKGLRDQLPDEITGTEKTESVVIEVRIHMYAQKISGIVIQKRDWLSKKKIIFH